MSADDPPPPPSPPDPAEPVAPPEPGDHDALPHLPAADPTAIPPDQGDPGRP